MLHFGRPGEGPQLKPGMFFTIEPMVNAGRPEVKVLDDGWTAVTRDRSLSAQFEHMIGVTETGWRSSPSRRPALQAALPRGLIGAGEPFVTTQKLRFCDTDAMGHVNNMTYGRHVRGRPRRIMFHGLGLLRDRRVRPGDRAVGDRLPFANELARRRSTSKPG